MEHKEMISFGAGVNSVAMTIMLVNEGWRGPIVFADPGAEHPDTYCYIEYFEREWLGKYGLQITRITPKATPHFYHERQRDLFIDEFCLKHSIVPLITSRWCTIEYKRRPAQNWSEGICDLQLIGFSKEESHRANRKGPEQHFPLLDRGIDRDGCKRIIKDAGLSVPPKSGCWFCPFQHINQWRQLYDLRPDLFGRAIELDEAAIKKSGAKTALCFKYNVQLKWLKYQWDNQLELPLMPEPEYEYQMCECRL